MTDFKAKMHQIRFRLGLRLRPRWVSLHRSPRPPSWIWGPLRGSGRGWAGEEEGKGRGRGGREREGTQVTVEPGPLRALLCHWADVKWVQCLRYVFANYTVHWVQRRSVLLSVLSVGLQRAGGVGLLPR